MKTNLNVTQRIIRVVVGLIVIVAGVYYKNWLGALGILPLFSAATGYCPLCCNKGGSSCSMPVEEKKNDDHQHGGGCCH